MCNCQEEIFELVAAIMPFNTSDEVIALANDSIYALGEAVFSTNITQALNVARSIQTGCMWVNTYNQIPKGFFFGSYKQSGIGRETHKMMLENYTQYKNIPN